MPHLQQNNLVLLGYLFKCVSMRRSNYLGHWMMSTCSASSLVGHQLRQARQCSEKERTHVQTLINKKKQNFVYVLQLHTITHYLFIRLQVVQLGSRYGGFFDKKVDFTFFCLFTIATSYGYLCHFRRSCSERR